MTRFIESFATQYLLPPWISRDVSTWVFALALENSEGVAGFLHDYFNAADLEDARKLAPSPYVYEPLDCPQQYAFLVVADHMGAASVQEEDGIAVVRNRVAYRIVYTTIPVQRHLYSPDKRLLKTDIVWVRPATWCNSSTFVFSAREIWGADVEYQQIDRDTAVAEPALHLDTSYIGCDPFAPSSFNELLAALHVRVGSSKSFEDFATLRKENAALGKETKVDADLMDLVEQLVGLKGNAEKAPPGLSDAARSIDIDALKQFRAAEDMGLAIFRGMVASRQWHRQPRRVARHDLKDVEVYFLRSAAVAGLHDQFGLTPSGRGAAPDHPAPETPPPPPRVPGAPPTEIRWDLPRAPADVKLCLSFKTDLYFEVLDTLHVYRPADQA